MIKPVHNVLDTVAGAFSAQAAIWRRDGAPLATNETSMRLYVSVRNRHREAVRPLA
jgi:hypothetical protein